MKTLANVIATEEQYLHILTNIPETYEGVAMLCKEEFMEGIRKILEDLLETYGSIEKAAEVWKKEDQENLNQLQNYWNVEL